MINMHCPKAHIWNINECQKCKAQYLSRVIEDIKKIAGRRGYQDVVNMIGNMDDEDYIIKER
jgi:hypothetical protein